MHSDSYSNKSVLHGLHPVPESLGWHFRGSSHVDENQSLSGQDDPWLTSDSSSSGITLHYSVFSQCAGFGLCGHRMIQK